MLNNLIFHLFSGITLISLVVPVACGVFVNYKWPKAAKIILRVMVSSLHVIMYCIKGEWGMLSHFSGFLTMTTNDTSEWQNWSWAHINELYCYIICIHCIVI